MEPYVKAEAMTQNERKLIRQVMRLCEKQYRKGFQQGAHFAMTEGDTTKADAFRDIGSKQDYRQFMLPEGVLRSGKYHATQLSGECAMPDMEELSCLLEEIADVDMNAEEIAAHGKVFEPSPVA